MSVAPVIDRIMPSAKTLRGRDLVPRQIEEIEAAMAKGGTVPVYTANLRKLLLLRETLLAVREGEMRSGVPLIGHEAKDLPAAQIEALSNACDHAAEGPASRVKMLATELRALMSLRAELLRWAAAAAHFDAAVQMAELAGGAREIHSRSPVRRTILVGAGHSGNQQARTYGFETQQLAAFFDCHPETVRKAIRDGALVPTDLASIYQYKLETDSKTAIRDRDFKQQQRRTMGGK